MRRIVRDRLCIGCERRKVIGHAYCPACKLRIRRGRVLDTSDSLTYRDVQFLERWAEDRVALATTASTLG